MFVSSSSASHSVNSIEALISACAEGKPAAWQEFIQRFHRTIALTAYRVARRWVANSETVVADVAQETYLKLCADRARILREFDCPGPDAITAFLKVVTTNVAIDYFKRQHAGKRGGLRINKTLEDAERECGPAVPSVRAGLERKLLLDQVEACLLAVTPAETRERDCTLFWLYYRQGWTAKEIAGLSAVGLSLKGVESTLHRLTQLVRNRLAEPPSGQSLRKEKRVSLGAGATF
jgi:RNA polymerase sigma-70 factor, ECF subfamily